MFELIPESIQYMVKSLMMTVSLTYLSNFFIKRKKGFAELVKKINEYGDEIEEIDGEIAESADAYQRREYLKKEMDKKSEELASIQMKAKFLMGIMGFIINRFMLINYKGLVILKSPFKLFFPLSKIAHSGLENPTPYDINIQLFSFMFNQGIRTIVAKKIQIKLPRAIGNPIGTAKRLFGIKQSETEDMEKMSSWLESFF